MKKLTGPKRDTTHQNYHHHTKQHIGGEGAAALSASLKTNRARVTLELWGNGIGAAGAQSAEMLKVRPC